MKFKLDENFGTRTQHIFAASGHDVHTVFDEGLQGASDPSLYEICCHEQRCLVTLDLDFSDVVRFPPEACGEIVVIRSPQNPSLMLLENLVRTFLQALSTESLKGRLWIVEPGRIRLHQARN